MEDIDEGVGFSESAESNKKLADTGIRSMKQLNGLSFAEKLHKPETDSSITINESAKLENGEHEVSEESNQGNEGKEIDNNVTDFSSTVSVEDNKENPDTDTNGCNLNGIDKVSDEICDRKVKSPFFLAKARDSLKDLQAKVRPSSDKKQEMESTFNQHEVEKHPDNQKEMEITQTDLQPNASERHESFMSEVLADESLSNSGSNLLEKVSETVEKDVVSETVEKDVFEDTGKKDDEVDSNEDMDEDKLIDGSFEDGVHMEIASDTEDDLLQLSPSEYVRDSEKQKLVTTGTSDVLVSFDDDSNSNQNTEKVQSAMKILNQDISNTLSIVSCPEKPFVSNEKNEVVNLERPEISEERNMVVDLESPDVICEKNEDDGIKRSDTCKPVTEVMPNDSQTTNSVPQVNAGTEHVRKDSSEDKQCHETVDLSNEKTEIEEIEISPQKSPNSVKDKADSMEEEDDDVIFEGESKLDLEPRKEKSVDERSNTDKLTENNTLHDKVDHVGPKVENKTNGILESDDVIFEGESKLDIESRKEKLMDELSTKDTLLEKKELNHGETNHSKSISDNKETSVVESDDDVIFEKETKIDLSVKDICHENGSVTEVKENTLKETTCTEKLSKNIEIIECMDQQKPKSVCDIKEKLDSNLTIAVDGKCAISDRKRPADEPQLVSADLKRSKLESDKDTASVQTAAKEEPASINLIDSDDEMDTSTKEEKQSLPEHKTAVSNDTEKPKENKMITLSEKELEDLVREKVKAYLASQRETLLAQLSQKVKDFNSNIYQWKKQVKDLQIKVNDVTVLQQKHEKRKAHTAALRQITTRSVAVQVDDGRTASAKKQQAAANQTNRSPTKLVTKSPPFVMTPTVTAPPGANGMIRLPIPQSSLAPPVLSAPLPQQTQIVTPDYKTPTVKSLLGTTRTQPTISSAATTSATSTASVINVQYQQRVVTNPPSSSASFITIPTGNVNNVPTKIVTTKTGGTAKIIDLTDDEPKVLVTLPQGMSAATAVGAQTPGVRTILSSQPQLVRGFPNTSGTFQLVLSPGTQQIRPGTIVTGLPQTLIQTIPQSAAPVVNLTTQNTRPVTTTVVARAPPPLQTPVTNIPKTVQVVNHPAPLPAIPPVQISAPKAIPPKPNLRVSRVNQGIVLSWNMTLGDNVAEIQSYQLFAYQETNAPPVSSLWKKVGDVKALPLPMACTLTQFQVGNKYHFAVRAMDVHNRVSPYSDPSSLHMIEGKTADKQS